MADTQIEIHPVDRHVGERLKARRKKLDLSQAKLGELVGLSLQQIQKYEQGINRVAASKLYEFSQILQVPITYFYDGVDAKMVSQSQDNADKTICFTRTRPLSILLIEDNPADEVLTRKALDACPIKSKIIAVHDGVEALQSLKSRRASNRKPDIILLDLNIPQMDGLAVLKELKKDRDLIGIPVVVLTNSINPEDMTNAYKAGASGFMAKSFDINKFNEQIANLVSYWSSSIILPSMQETT